MSARRPSLWLYAGCTGTTRHHTPTSLRIRLHDRATASIHARHIMRISVAGIASGWPVGSGGASGLSSVTSSTAQTGRTGRSKKHPAAERSEIAATACSANVPPPHPGMTPAAWMPRRLLRKPYKHLAHIARADETDASAWTADLLKHALGRAVVERVVAGADLVVRRTARGRP